MSNILFLGGVPDERQKRRKRKQENKRQRPHIFARLSPRHPYYLRAWNKAIKTLHVFLVLKQIHPQGTKGSSEGISTNNRRARV